MKNNYNTFMEKVYPEPNTGCWLWINSISVDGYGRFNFNCKPYMAHRFSYLIHKGDIPNNLFVCHSCDVPSCVNPDHLFLGTAEDNNKDRSIKGRSTKGTKSKLSKLTDKQVIEIRQLFNSKKETSKVKLAKQFGVHLNTIYEIVGSKIWKHLLPK